MKIVVRHQEVGTVLRRNLVQTCHKIQFLKHAKPRVRSTSPALATQYPERDWILSRILWLAGLEAGFNQGEGCDTYQRYIYIHGTPDTEPMGVPISHGCIRMRNTDVMELFELIPVDATVIFKIRTSRDGICTDLHTYL